MNRTNLCRCAKKTRGFMLAGYVDPGSLLFTREHLEQIREVVRTKAEALTTLDAQCTEAAPALLMVSTHRAMVTTARCTEVAS